MEGDCNVYAHSSLWIRPTGLIDIMRKWCIWPVEDVSISLGSQGKFVWNITNYYSYNVSRPQCDFRTYPFPRTAKSHGHSHEPRSGEVADLRSSETGPLAARPTQGFMPNGQGFSKMGWWWWLLQSYVISLKLILILFVSTTVIYLRK